MHKRYTASGSSVTSTKTMCMQMSRYSHARRACYVTRQTGGSPIELYLDYSVIVILPYLIDPLNSLVDCSQSSDISIVAIMNWRLTLTHTALVFFFSCYVISDYTTAIITVAMMDPILLCVYARFVSTRVVLNTATLVSVLVLCCTKPLLEYYIQHAI
ncbi:hypothetical protein GQ44DRAFT_731636 [Phaeosphaeriaceae sp. PMI808]|nr:hypothetical protein GQ44DRAFT_731636 [Phaeosphaeriaceae sp. PMI808]